MDILKNAKNAVRKIARNKIGSDRESQAREILYMGVGLNLELMVILLSHSRGFLFDVDHLHSVFESVRDCTNMFWK